MPGSLSLDVAHAMPETPDELTPEWLTWALASRRPGVTVTAAAVSTIVWGTATKVLMTLDFAPGAPDDLLRSVCVKGGFDPALREFGLGSSYRREAEFYAHLAPQLDIALPRVWYSGADAAGQQGIVVMEDLAAGGFSFGECTEPMTVDQVASGLDVLAGLHGGTWGADPGRFPWLTQINPVREVGALLLDAPYWDQHFASEYAPVVPDELLDRPRMQAAFAAWWRYAESDQYVAVSHNDPHIGNTYLAADGQVSFLDWQAVCAAPAMDDVAYFISGALSVEDRRERESALLAHYLEALARHGGPDLNLDDVWDEYRMNLIHGFFWALTGPQMQRADRVAAMAERHLAAMIDHETVPLLLNRGASEGIAISPALST
ncbi:phosphotransferase [Mycolicibacterium anyangense]|nr:phosphotransferase [Mycolicibacterium anyangense]